MSTPTAIPSQSQSRPRADAVLLFVASVVLSLAATSCCGSFDSEATRKDTAARQWLHRWQQESLDWTEFHRWANVKDSASDQADYLLRESAFVPLTEAQAVGLAGDSKSAVGRPYLLRGVGPANRKFPQEVYVGTNGEVWVGGGANSRCPVPMERHAVIAWLESPPREVYVTFVVAK